MEFRDEKKALLEHFADLEDPHMRQSPHELMELLRVAVTRRCVVTDDLRCLEKPSDWRGIQMPVSS